MITFPDGSTITKQVTLHVTYNPELHKTNSEVTGLPAGAKIANGQVIDANGHVLAGYTVVNGQIVKTNGEVNGTNSAVNNNAKRSDLDNGKLPQTSNANQAGLVGLGVASMLGMFGLAGIRRNQN